MWDALEGDFQQYYRIDLAQDIWTMTWRRFLVLLGTLPEESITRATIRHDSGVRNERDTAVSAEQAGSVLRAFLGQSTPTESSLPTEENTDG